MNLFDQVSNDIKSAMLAKDVESDYRSGRSYYSARDGKGDGSSYQTVGRACRWPRYFCESKRTVGLIQNKYLN